MRRLFARVLMAVVAACSSGCIVVALDHFYDEHTLTSDGRLVGTWVDADDHTTVTIGQSEWQSYRVQYDHPTEKGVLTGFLFKAGTKTYLDVMPVRGQDLGLFALPAHALVLVTIDADVLTVRPLMLEWFSDRLGDHTLPASLNAVRGERSQIVLATSHDALLAWLAARLADDPAFGPTFTFKRQALPAGAR
jgi:hypothetical protein